MACGTNSTCQATLRSGRPLQASRILEGLSPEKALHRLPLVFSLCGNAQSVAAVNACEEALAITPSAPQQQARGMLVWMESAREHLLRILLDWPAFADEPVQRDGLPKVMRLLPSMTHALYGEAVPFRLGSRPKVDIDMTKETIAGLRAMIDQLLGGRIPTSRSHFEDWLKQGKTLPARLLRRLQEQGWDQLGQADSVFLPPLETGALHKQLDATEANTFIATPIWQGRPCETTPLQRQQDRPLIRELLEREGNGLLTRFMARLVELASIPDLLQAGLAVLSPSAMGVTRRTSDTGIGLAQVEAARGRLVHRVEIDKGVIQRYQILAPTEWNFHPEGIAVQGLQTLSCSNDEQLQQQAKLWINAIDPCVGFQLQVRRDA